MGSVRSEPQTFNRLVAVETASSLVADLTHAPLVRVDRETDELRPWLARGWTRSDDGLRYQLELRRDLRFSDGQPFTSADVLFSFEAAYDPDTPSPVGDSLRIDGQPLEVTAPDEWTVEVVFPEPFSPGLRVLASLPILPRHRLESALREGRFADAWGVATPLDELAGLGPFVLETYLPGQRLVFARNPEYWRTDTDGMPLPRLDRLTLEIVTDQDAEMLRFEAGEIDFTLTEARPEDYAALVEAESAGRAQLRDLGVALDPDFLFFNLHPQALADDPRRAWLQADDFRRAVSQAVDRRVFAETVYLGLGEPVFGPITPSNHAWHNDALTVLDHDPAAARARLDGLGLEDRDGDGIREDASGEPVRFTLLTHRGHSARERATAVIAEDLRGFGVAVDVVPLDLGALVERVMRQDFEAAYVGFRTSDTDPAANLDLWLSGSSFHFWYPNQPEPATPWEARIDELMGENMTTTDLAVRRRTFDEVQQIFADYVPAVYFAAPRVVIALSPRVANAQPSLLLPLVLWNADTLARADAPRATLE